MLGGRVRLEMVEVRDAERLARRLPERAFACALDPTGERLDSLQFAAFLQQRRHSGRDLCFVLGGPHGLEGGRWDHSLSLGPMTLPHQLARVVLMEQIYRAHRILAGEPYHH